MLDTTRADDAAPRFPASRALSPIPALEEFRKTILAGIDAYEARRETELTIYRQQRAWRLMLAARRAYTLLARRGWKGRWSFPGMLWRLVRGNGSELDTEELFFPSVANYLPEELYYPISDAVRAGRPLEADLSHTKRLCDFFVFPVFEYDFRFQRPQQIAAELARRGHRVFWISPTRMLRESAPEKYHAIALRENLTEIQIRMRPQDLYGGTLEDRDLDALKAALADVADDFSIATACSLVQFPYWRRCALALRDLLGTKVLYDCMDDWQGWTAEPFDVDELGLISL